MSNGTLNLSWFYRAMGIKNPEPTLRETVQPVVVVGQFEGLTPRYQNPTYLGGGEVGVVGGQWGMVQVTSRAPGGSVVQEFQSNQHSIRVGIVATPTVGLVAVPDRGPLSVEAATCYVASGTGADPLTGAHPMFRNTLQMIPVYIPTGRTLCFSIIGVATGFNWNIIIEDLPAAEIPPA